ncbi:MAG: hypothetical protein WCE53_09085 [Candidatus Acidiferrum sp.]
MRKPRTGRVRNPGQRGYALLLVMFFMALLVLTTITVAPNVLTDGRREKEKEMVWRGNQYVRGIRRYYAKTHRFPTEIDDLVKPKTGIRFMRQAYKDPMNDVDGSWRLIYVGPNGQLIGSLKAQVPGAPGMSTAGFGTPVSMMPGAQGSGSGFGSSSFGGSSFGSGNTSNSTMGSTGFGNSMPKPTGQPNANASGENAAGTDAMSTPQSIAPAETPVIIGGNIIGVGSKVNKESFLWYDKAKNYREFEFIWDPSKDMAGGAGGSMQTGPGLGTPVGAPNATSPFSSGFGQNPSQNPSSNPPMGPPEGGPPLQAPPPNQN